MPTQDAVRQWLGTVPSALKVIAIGALILGCSMLRAQTVAPKAGTGSQQVCQLISANPPDFHPFAFVPARIQDKGFKNRSPRISFVVGEDGRVRDVKILKGTGSSSVDDKIIKSVQEWRYKPQPGCVTSMSSVVTIDIR